MAVYEITPNGILSKKPITFRDAKIQERSDLQRLLRDSIEVIAPDCLVIAEEFGDWDDSRRRIDLLALDTDANLVVIELKRTEDGGHMELQAVRYAAMVSTMTFGQAVGAYERFLSVNGRGEEDAATNILEHLGWDEPDEDSFAQDVRIVLASAQFSREVTTAVMWLNERGLDIRCVRLIPYADGDRVLLDVQQVIPLPEAEEYQVRVREKSRKERESRASGRDYTKYFVIAEGERIGPLAKRETVLRVVRFLCGKGVSPDAIASCVTFRKRNAFWSVPGVYKSEDDFVAAATNAETGRRFVPQKWYTGDDERIEFEGRTYAVSKKWGGRAIEWLGQVLAAFPDHEVDIEAAD
ncbi:MAG: hypothetical protein EA423_11135 [Phycisphaerales bacterium]|nr:MAG: hypothetical protein EA423_11135 [Phycisphaerales bacterium]